MSLEAFINSLPAYYSDSLSGATVLVEENGNIYYSLVTTISFNSSDDARRQCMRHPVPGYRFSRVVYRGDRCIKSSDGTIQYISDSAYQLQFFASPTAVTTAEEVLPN